MKTPNSFVRFSIPVFLGIILSASTLGQTTVPFIFLAEGGSGDLQLHDPNVGNEVRQLDAGHGVAWGLDGSMYVTRDVGVVRYDPDGNYVGIFASHPQLFSPRSLVFGDNGNLFVASTGNLRVFQFDGVTGDYACVFYPMGGGPRGMQVSPTTGNLLVATAGHTVDEYSFSGVTPTYEGDFIAGQTLVETPGEIEFGPNGNLFIASSTTAHVVEYDGVTGSEVGNFTPFNYALMANPWGMEWNPLTGNLLVGSVLRDTIVEFDGTTGALLNSNWGALSGNLFDPGIIEFGNFVPEPTTLGLLVLGACCGMGRRRR